MQLSNTFELFEKDIVWNLVMLFLVILPSTCLVIWGAMLKNHKGAFVDLRKRAITFRLLFPFLFSLVLGGYFLFYSMVNPVRAILVIANGNSSAARIEVAGSVFEIEGNSHAKAFVRSGEDLGKLHASIAGQVVVEEALREGVSVLNLSLEEVLWPAMLVYSNEAPPQSVADAQVYYDPLALGLMHLVDDPWKEIYMIDEEPDWKIKVDAMTQLDTRLKVYSIPMEEFYAVEEIGFDLIPPDLLFGLIDRGESIMDLVNYHHLRLDSLNISLEQAGLLDP